MNEIQAAWLAGLIEGEGCLTIHRHCPVVGIAMTDRDVIERASALMGTTVRPIKLRPGQKQAWQTRACGQKAMRVLEFTLKHFGVRRHAKACEIVAETQAWAGRARGSHISEQAVVLLRHLEERGVPRKTLQDATGLSQPTISRVVRSVTHARVGVGLT